MREQPPAHPAGWYVIAFSDELAPGALMTRPFAGGEAVVFRTESGRAVATRPFCPHLGAHLGHGGEVHGETVRCPFHGFRFRGADGACEHGYPGKKVPPACTLRTFPLLERNGVIALWHHPHDRAPEWEFPELDVDGWRPLQHASWHLRGHPQECSENSVDFGHFAVVHHYDDTRVLTPAHVEGPLLHAKYHMARAAKGLEPATASDFEVWVWGLGYSVVQVHVEPFDMHVRTFVLPCPTEDGHIELRLAVSIKHLDDRAKLHPLARLVPVSILEWVIERGALRTYTADVRQDFEIWKNKTYLQRPRLAAGDGPIALYRKYVRQFYPDQPGDVLPKVAAK